MVVGASVVVVVLVVVVEASVVLLLLLLPDRPLDFIFWLTSALDGSAGITRFLPPTLLKMNSN